MSFVETTGAVALGLVIGQSVLIATSRIVYGIRIALTRRSVEAQALNTLADMRSRYPGVFDDADAVTIGESDAVTEEF